MTSLRKFDRYDDELSETAVSGDTRNQFLKYMLYTDIVCRLMIFVGVPAVSQATFKIEMACSPSNDG
jgi:hypothetical protein